MLGVRGQHHRPHDLRPVSRPKVAEKPRSQEFNFRLGYSGLAASRAPAHWPLLLDPDFFLGFLGPWLLGYCRPDTRPSGRDFDVILGRDLLREKDVLLTIPNVPMEQHLQRRS
jgi:hypothetical protein